MTRRAIVCAVLFLTAGCGSSPVQPGPSPSPNPPAPQTFTLSGTVTATNGGRPLAGATVEVGTVSTTTDNAGKYSVILATMVQSPRFVISGGGFLTRNGFFANGGSRTVDLDAFAFDTFDHAYFRAVARNGWEDPAVLQPIRRWTRAPMIYVRTIDDTGRAILPEVLQQVVTIATAVIPQYTNGRFGVAGFEQGVDHRRGQAGWITVDWVRQGDGFCGTSHVGQEGGVVTLTYDQPGCSCGSQKIRPRTVKHELGHSMGLWHTGQSVDLMSGLGVSECDRNMTARELQYLDYLYRRPVGNMDPDNDPSTAPMLRAVRVGD